MKSEPVTLQSRFLLEGSPRELWPFLSDTDRTNQLLGLPASREIVPDADLSRRITGRYLGKTVTWHDFPFEWVFERWFVSDRTFDQPVPFSRLRTRTTLEKQEGNCTQVTVDIELWPRNLIGRYGAPILIKQQMLQSTQRVYQQIATLAQTQIPLPPASPPNLHHQRLDLALGQLAQAGVEQRLIEQIATHLKTMDDRDVLHMRPFVLADRWGTPRIETLNAFLYATRSGLFDLEWDVMCPNCRGANELKHSLSDLAADAHCPACHVHYDLNFEELVELRFSVSPNVRTTEDTSYCVGGPANTRHIFAQTWIAPSESKQLTLTLPPGGYQIRSSDHHELVMFDCLEQADTQQLQIRIDHERLQLSTTQLNANDLQLQLTNNSDTSLLLIIEQQAWSAQAASAALVTAMPEFRRLFSSEVLAPGLGLSVRNLTFLFSDLKDSTAIYEHIGDAPAFARVRDHFEVLRAILTQHNGALVKTIGDAVMAVFSSVSDGVAASIAIQQAFVAGEIAQGRPALRIKLGLHSGPCIAVNANGLLDYFGSTVNTAARIQSESQGGDIVISREIYDDAEVHTLLEHEQPEIEEFMPELRGIGNKHLLYRLLLPSLILDLGAG